MKTKERGITLIALVVTIIVLLILAGISIMMLTGQTGILQQAGKAKTKTAHSEVYEALNLEAGEHLIGKYTKGYPQSVIDYFLEKGYIYIMEGIEGYIVSVETLLGAKTEYGNGTDGKTDVYKIEEITQEGEIGKVATTTPIKIAKTETGKTYKVVYYGKKANEEVQLGKITDGGTSTGTQVVTGEKLEDMYYLIGDYNDETKGIDNVRLYFLPDMYTGIYEKIIEESPDKFITEEELLAHEHILGYAGGWTFEEIMEYAYEDGCIEKKYATAKEFCMGHYGDTEEEYSKYIQRLRFKNEIEIEVSSGSEVNGYYFEGDCPISGMGQYEFTIKIYGEVLKKFTVSIDQYEIIYAYDYNYNYIDGIVAYDFTNEKILTINDGEYGEYREKETTMEKIPNEDIDTIEGRGSVIETNIPYDLTYYFKLKNNNIIVNGYYYHEEPTEM